MSIAKTFLEIICYPLKIIFIALIKIYQLLISSMFPRKCRFYPTCSSYMLLSIKEWGFIKGSFFGLKRIFRCRPRVKGGEDFVPLNIKGEYKWIF